MEAEWEQLYVPGMLPPQPHPGHDCPHRAEVIVGRGGTRENPLLSHAPAGDSPSHLLLRIQSNNPDLLLVGVIIMANIY